MIDPKMVVKRTIVAIFHESIGKGSTSEGEMAYNQDIIRSLRLRPLEWAHGFTLEATAVAK